MQATMAAVVVGCVRRFEHSCSTSCGARVADTVIRIVLAATESPFAPPSKKLLKSDALDDLRSSIESTLGLDVISAAAVDLRTTQARGIEIDVAPRTLIDGAPYGGTVEVWLDLALWEAFSLAGRLRGGLREAHYFRDRGNFEVRFKRVIVYGERAVHGSDDLEDA